MPFNDFLSGSFGRLVSGFTSDKLYIWLRERIDPAANRKEWAELIWILVKCLDRQLEIRVE
jgi:hypothetical protein